MIHTGTGTHGLYPSRDGTRLYASNRGSHRVHGGHMGEGSIGVIEFATRKVVANWPIPGGGSPDMGNVSADGKTLWLSGRFDNVVYAIDTTDGTGAENPGRHRAARPDRVAAARPLFARAYREHAVKESCGSVARMGARADIRDGRPGFRWRSPRLRATAHAAYCTITDLTAPPNTPGSS